MLLPAKALLVLLGALVPSGDVDEARELLKEVGGGLRDAPTLAFECEESVSRTEGWAKTGLGLHVFFKRPNLARVEFRDKGGLFQLVVLDGTTLWIWGKSDNRYMKYPQSKRMATQLGLAGLGPVPALFFEGKPERWLKDAKTVAVSREKLGKDPCRVVRRRSVDEELLWIGEGTVIRRYETRTMTRRQAWDFAKIDLSPATGRETFTFTVPEGARRRAGHDSEEGLLAVGKQAPDFTATDLDGKTVRLSDLKGKVAVLNFWFYDCAPCRQELPHLQKLYEEYKGRGVVVLAVNVGDSASTIRALFQKESFTFRPLQQKGKEISRSYGVRAYPTNYVVGPGGRIAARRVGYDGRMLRRALDALVRKK